MECTHIICESSDFVNVWIPIISAAIGGGLTLIGVVITLFFQNIKRKEEIKMSYKPYLCYMNPMQDYNDKHIEYFSFRNETVSSKEHIELTLKNTDNAILVMDKIRVDDKYYYPFNGNIVDKSTVFNIYIDISDDIVNKYDSEVVLYIRDVLGNNYYYKLSCSKKDKTNFDVIEELKKTI